MATPEGGRRCRHLGRTVTTLCAKSPAPDLALLQEQQHPISAGPIFYVRWQCWSLLLVTRVLMLARCKTISAPHHPIVHCQAATVRHERVRGCPTCLMTTLTCPTWWSFPMVTAKQKSFTLNQCRSTWPRIHISRSSLHQHLLPISQTIHVVILAGVVKAKHLQVHACVEVFVALQVERCPL